MKAFLDTNVMLDFLGERDPFYLSSAKIATLADKGKIEIVVSALSYATVSYFLSKFETETNNFYSFIRFGYCVNKIKCSK